MVSISHGWAIPRKVWRGTGGERGVKLGEKESFDQVKIEPPGRTEEEESDQEFSGMQVYSLNLNCEPGQETQMSSSPGMPNPCSPPLSPSSKADSTNGP